MKNGLATISFESPGGFYWDRKYGMATSLSLSYFFLIYKILMSIDENSIFEEKIQILIQKY